jgi:transposase
VEDSLRVKAKEIGSDGHCIHGFDDGEGASARTWGDAKKRGQGIGRNVAGTGTKIHVIMGEKRPLRVPVSGANVHDSRMAYRMMDGLNLKAVKRFVADKGYDDDKLIWWLKTQDIEAEIPPRCNRKVKRLYDKTVYAWRRRIENLFAKLKENRRLALRVDKLEATFGGFIALALIKMDVC